MKILISLTLIIIAGFAVYINSLNGEFILDDYSLIHNNVFIRKITHIPEIFKNDIFAGTDRSIKGRFYRPLQSLSYMLDYSLWKLNQRGYHFTNMLLHIMAALSIVWLIYILYDDWLISSLTGILFVIHPIHTEAVAYISGRADSLSLLFMLLGFIFYIKYSRLKRKIFLILTILSYIAALLSKENSLIFPLLLILYHYTFRKKLNIKGVLSVVIIASCYIILRLTFLRSLIPDFAGSTNLFQRIPGFFVAMTDYTRLIILPFNQHMEYGSRVFGITNPKAIAGILIICALLFYAFRKKDTNRPAFFSILWFFITLMPQSNIYPINAYMAEHWLYVPSIGFFLMLAGGLSYLYRSKRFKMAAVVLMAVVVAGFSFLTIRQNSYWMKPSSFFEKTLKLAPANTRIYNNLGTMYMGMGKGEEAIAAFKKAIELNPIFIELDVCYNNLGAAYKSIGKNDEALLFYKKAIEINPRYTKAYNNLGNIYTDLGEEGKAIESYRKAIELSPYYVKAYNNLAKTYTDIGENEEALILYEKSIEVNPRYAETYIDLGNLYYNLGRKEKALASYEKAKEINPNNVKSYNNLGITYYELGQRQKALELFKKAIEIDPDFAETYNNMGLMYHKLGRMEQAIASYKKSVEINPESARAYYNLGLTYRDTGRIKEALLSFKKAIEIDPHYINAYNNLSALFLAAGKYNEAISLLKKALEINPDYADTHNNLAVAYYYQKQYDLAIKHCDEAIELGSKIDPEFLKLLKAIRRTGD